MRVRKRSRGTLNLPVTTGRGAGSSNVVVARASQGLVRVGSSVVVGGRGRSRGRGGVPAGLSVPVRVPVVGGMVVVRVRAVQGRVIAVRVRRAAGRIDSGRILRGWLMLGLSGYHGGKGQNSDLQTSAQAQEATISITRLWIRHSCTSDSSRPLHTDCTRSSSTQFHISDSHSLLGLSILAHTHTQIRLNPSKGLIPHTLCDTR